ncbi:MAG: GNAT family N-acetyltransferase [Elusimicrobiota bacterium]|nr:GNAT family N-acetyltransferase [Elusimicrobiota bacterium]
MRRIGARLATADDVDAAGGLAAVRSPTAWTRRGLAAELAREDALFAVVTDDDGVAGYAVARFVEKECRLLDFVVAEDGLGLGRVLWAFLVEEARRRGAASLTLEVSQKNRRAWSFYVAAGAKEVGWRPKFYADGSAAVLMDLDLLKL